jgi:hypothetical protein
MEAYLDYILGAVFVGLYAIDRISSPKMNMATTTAQRYWSMVLIYAGASIMLFILAATILQYVGIDYLKAFLPNINFDAKLSPPLLMALFMTVLLAKIPGLSKLDEAIRTEFRRRASMSSIAANLSHILENSPFNLSDSKRKTIINDLQEQEIDLKDVMFDNDGSPQYLWTRITVLLQGMKSWETDPTYRSFIETYHREWETLIEQSELHEAKAIRCFRLGSVAGNDEKLTSALKDCRRHYSEQLTGLLTQLCDFMGRGISLCNRNPEARRTALVAIGIDARVNVGYTVHQITMVFLLALGVTILLPLFIDLVNSVLTRSAGESTGGTHSAYLIRPYMFKIAVGYACAGLIALRLHYRMQKSTLPIQDRPWGRYLLAGVLAVFLASFADFVIDALSVALHLGNRSSLADIPQSFITSGWIYQIRVLVLGFVLSYLIDTPPKRNLRHQQWLETVITGVIMLVVGYFILRYINSPEMQAKLRYSLDAYRFLPASLLLGALIGYWLPTSSRQLQERVLESPDDHNDPSSVAVVH